jgi:hypothetical protein
MGMVVTLSEASSITYSRKYNYAVKFETAPSPFSEWFPAVSCDLKVGSTQSKGFKIGTRNVKLPITRGDLTLKISYVDDDNHSLLQWIDAWCNSLTTVKVNGVDYSGSRVLPLASAVRNCWIRLLTVDKQPAGEDIVLSVYPDGDFSVNKAADSGIFLQEGSFHVAGRARSSTGGVYSAYNAVGSSLPA